MNPTEEIAARLVGGAQAAYVRELSYFFLHLFGEVVRTNGAVLKGQEIADFDRLARISREEALDIYYKYRPYIEKQTRETLKRSLKATDDILIGQFIRVLGKRRHMTNLATLIGSQTAQGLYEVINRQNIALAEQQEALWYEVTAEAIARHQAGEPTKTVMERGVSKLANSGLETIDYISGTKTTIDAALRRHIVSQANQARNRLLMQRMDEWEWDLVFVDAHFGARPTHAVWQGKVYSRSGRSTEYPPLVESTGYGTVTGLCGANCYHNMVPYVPGLSQLPDTDFADQEKLVGMTSDEYYAVTQKQRRYERYIRTKKREIVSFQEAGLDATKQRLQLGTAQDKLRQWVADNHLRRDYQRERAWAVDRQPRALKVVNRGDTRTASTSRLIKTAEKRTDKLLAKAQAIEPVVTQTLKSLQTDNRHLAGLEYRLKSRESLLRKIMSDVKVRGAKLNTKKKVNDVLRYTFESDAMYFVDNFADIRSSLEGLGYKFVRVKNTLKDKSAVYRGVNTQVKTPDGYTFEIQFHTPQSLAIKEKNHVLYEQARVLDLSTLDGKNQSDELERQMLINSQTISVLPRIDEVKK